MDTKTIIGNIMEIPGVTSIIIMKKDGTVIDSLDSLETDNALLGLAATTISDSTSLFTLGNANRVVIKGPGYKILIVITDEHFIGLTMDEDVDENLVGHTIDTIISTSG